MLGCLARHNRTRDGYCRVGEDSRSPRDTAPSVCGWDGDSSRREAGEDEEVQLWGRGREAVVSAGLDFYHVTRGHRDSCKFKDYSQVHFFSVLF